MNELLIPEEYRQEIRSIKAELEELEARKGSIHRHSFGEPGNRVSRRSGAYFEDTVIRYDTLYSKLIQTSTEYFDAKNRLFQKINRLKNQNYADVLCYRYISGYTIKQISDQYGCNDRWVYKLLQRAKKEYERVYKDDENKCEL